MEVSASAGMHGRRAIQRSRIMSCNHTCTGDPDTDMRRLLAVELIYAWVIRGIKRPVRNRGLNHNSKVLLLHHLIPGPRLATSRLRNTRIPTFHFTAKGAVYVNICRCCIPCLQIRSTLTTLAI